MSTPFDIPITQPSSGGARVMTGFQYQLTTSDGAAQAPWKFSGTAVPHYAENSSYDPSTGYFTATPDDYGYWQFNLNVSCQIVNAIPTPQIVRTNTAKTTAYLYIALDNPGLSATGVNPFSTTSINVVYKVEAGDVIYASSGGSLLTNSGNGNWKINNNSHFGGVKLT